MHLKRKHVYEYFLTNKGTAVDCANSIKEEYHAVYYHIRELVRDGQLYRSESKRGQDGYTYSTVRSAGYVGKPRTYKIQGKRYEFEEAICFFWAKYSTYESQLQAVQAALASLLVRARYPEITSLQGIKNQLEHIQDFQDANKAISKLLDDILTSGLVSDPKSFMYTVGTVHWEFIMKLNEAYSQHQDEHYKELSDVEAFKHALSEFLIEIDHEVIDQ